MQQVPLPPGTESWAERYGVIGVVALLALAALILGLRQFLNERKEDRDRQAKEQEAHDQQVSALNAKLVETVAANHRETLKIVAELQDKHEARYGALLERHMGDSGKHAEALRAQSAAVTDVLRSVVAKIRGAE